MDLISIYTQFPEQKDCIKHLEKARWMNEPACPYCLSKNMSNLKKEHRYHCNNCNTSYSVTVGTIFHNTKLPLQKWFLAISIILNEKRRISARQLGKDLGITKDTAWRISMQIRNNLNNSGTLLKAISEVEETNIGGKKN